MFERFTQQGRQVVVLAQEEARSLRHNYIGSEHILLGLLREHEGVAAHVLGSLDITVERARDQVVRIVSSGEEPTSGQIPFTPRAKKILELALREARSLDHDCIGPEHILLGVLRENEGVAVRVLVALDADPRKVRDVVLRKAPGPGEGPPLEPRPGRLVLEPSFDYPIHVRLAPHLRRLLMSAAARALDDGRTDTELRDLMLALARDEQAVALLSRLGIDETSVRRAINASDPPDQPPAEPAE